MSTVKTLIRCASWGIALLFGGVLLYALGACVCGVIAINRDFAPPAAGTPQIEFFLRNNGIHTDFVLPLDDPLAKTIVDWRARHPGSHFAPPAKQPKYPIPLDLDADKNPATNPLATHLAIGWGDQGFYLDTPEWEDLTARVALRALSGTGKPALHVEYTIKPSTASPRIKRILVSPDTYAKLTAHLVAQFEQNAAGELVRIPNRGYTPHDTFYEARGAFSMLSTCNEWVRQGLSAAGIRTALWAPFHQGIYHHLP